MLHLAGRLPRSRYNFDSVFVENITTPGGASSLPHRACIAVRQWPKATLVPNAVNAAIEIVDQCTFRYKNLPGQGILQ